MKPLEYAENVEWRVLWTVELAERAGPIRGDQRGDDELVEEPAKKAGDGEVEVVY
jgi:hypothetical protein